MSVTINTLEYLGPKQQFQLQLAKSGTLQGVYAEKVLELAQLSENYIKSGYMAGDSELSTFASQALADIELEKGRILVPFLNDQILSPGWNVSMSRTFANEVFVLLLYLDSDVFDTLMEKSVVDLCRPPGSLVRQVQLKYYLDFPTGDYGIWKHKYPPILKKNQELLGSKQIKIAGKEVAQTVQHWLEDYVGFVGKPDGQREALDRINFVNKSSNVKLLTEEERKILLKLLELFDWFCDPYVTKEVVEYFEGPRENSVPARVTTTQSNGAGAVAAAQASQNPEPAVVEPSEEPVSTATSPQATNDVERRAQTVAQSKPESRVETVTKKQDTIQTSFEEPLLPPPPHEELLEPAHGLLGEVESSDLGHTAKGTNTQPSPGMSTAGDVDTEKLEQERKSKGVKMPSLAKPLVVGGVKQEVGVKIPPKLDLDEIKTQAQKQKQEVQEDIDDKLEDLSEHM